MVSCTPPPPGSGDDEFQEETALAGQAVGQRCISLSGQRCTTTGSGALFVNRAGSTRLYTDVCSGTRFTDYSCSTKKAVKRCISSCPEGQRCNAGQCVSLCGNGRVDAGETCSSCARDVVCATGQQCDGGVCVVLLVVNATEENVTEENRTGQPIYVNPVCGNGVVEAGENCLTCVTDVTCQSGTQCVLHPNASMGAICQRPAGLCEVTGLPSYTCNGVNRSSITRTTPTTCGINVTNTSCQGLLGFYTSRTFCVNNESSVINDGTAHFPGISCISPPRCDPAGGPTFTCNGNNLVRSAPTTCGNNVTETSCNASYVTGLPRSCGMNVSMPGGTPYAVCYEHCTPGETFFSSAYNTEYVCVQSGSLTDWHYSRYCQKTGQSTTSCNGNNLSESFTTTCGNTVSTETNCRNILAINGQPMACGINQSSSGSRLYGTCYAVCSPGEVVTKCRTGRYSYAEEYTCIEIGVNNLTGWQFSRTSSSCFDGKTCQADGRCG